MTRYLAGIGVAGALALGSAAAPPQAVELRLVSQRPLGGAGYAELGLTGENKPNGLEYRLRRSVPPELPGFVPRTRAGLELFIADRTADGWLAFYRGPLAGLPDSANVPFRTVFFNAKGQRRWELELNPLLSRPDHLEVQDVRYADGRLYFNEACQSYSREAGGRCSALVRVDPARRRVEWRTGPLVSNNVFLVHGRWLIAGYGFTAEPDFVHVVDRGTGRVLARRRVDSAPSYFEIKDGRLHVVTHTSMYVFALRT
ncbi:MAG TPA: hypothetical protein VFX98_05430 [Longimicrobiaceae bacterium]|nr:hypothetical protein [Longimicrobiaceae bacterium]